MIILDLNQVIFSSILPNIMSGKTDQIDEDLVRHIIMNIIRKVRVEFKKEYGELVIANDNRTYWRKEIFPFYKASRKKTRAKINIDWTVFYSYVDKIKEEIQTCLPYRYLDVERAEADDIIGTLVRGLPEKGPFVIVSSDKDMIQLHGPNVRQYDLVHKKWVKNDDPKAYLFEHIIKGDVGDGIPNVVSPDNCFVVGDRQKKVTKDILESVVDIDSQPDHRLYRNYMRNKTLVDLSMIPLDIQKAILNKYESTTKAPRSKMMMYFASKELNTLAIKINDF